MPQSSIQVMIEPTSAVAESSIVLKGTHSGVNYAALRVPTNQQLVGTACVSVLHGVIRLAGLLLSSNDAPISVDAILENPLVVYVEAQKSPAECGDDESAPRGTANKLHAEVHQLVTKSLLINGGDERNCLILVSALPQQEYPGITNGILPLASGRVYENAEVGLQVLPGLYVKNVKDEEIFQCEHSSCKSASHLSIGQMSSCNGKGRIIVVSTRQNRSRACNILRNQILAKAGQVLLIDANVRFPILNPPGVIGIYICREYQVSGEAHSCSRVDGFGKPVQARLFGFDFTERDYSRYVRLLCSIIPEARKLSWMSDVPILMCAEARAAESVVFADVLRQYDPSIVLDATSDSFLERSGNVSEACQILLDYHPDLTTNKQDEPRTMTTMESKLVQYFLPDMWQGRVLQIPAITAPIWPVGAYEVQNLEVGMLLAFFDETFELQPDNISHRWKAFGLVRGVDVTLKRVQIVAPCSQKELKQWQYCIVPNVCLSGTLDSLNNDQVCEKWRGDFPFYVGESTSNAAAMKSRNNLTRHIADFQSR